MTIIPINKVQSYLLLMAHLRYRKAGIEEIDQPEFYADLDYVKANIDEGLRGRFAGFPEVERRWPGPNDLDYLPWRRIIDQKIEELLMCSRPVRIKAEGFTAGEIITRADEQEIRNARFQSSTLDIEYRFNAEVAEIFDPPTVSAIQSVVSQVNQYGQFASLRWLQQKIPFSQ